MSTTGAGSGGPSKINKYVAEKPTYEESMAAHKKMLQDFSTIVGVEVTSLEDFKLKLLQKRLNKNIVEGFKKLPPRLQIPVLDSLRKDIFTKWGPRGPNPRKEGELSLYIELYGGFKEVLTDEYYKSLLTRIEIERLEKQVKAIEANVVAKTPSMSAKGMANYTAKIQKNINNASKKAAVEEMKEIEEYLKGEPGLGANVYQQILNNMNRARKNAAAEANIEKRLAALRPKQGGKRKTMRKQTKRRQTRRRA